MQRTITKTVYQFAELSDKAKEKAREWYRSCSDSSDLDNVIEDFTQIAEIIGLELDTHSVKLYGGGTRQEPEIFYSIGYCQSDYAAFAGTWKYKAGCLKAIKEYAPQNTGLHSIVSDWQALQKTNFYRLRAICSESRGNQYVDEVVKGYSSRYDEESVDYKTEHAAGDIVTDLARWLYCRLRDECDYQSSDEYVDEAIEANELEFYENGERVRSRRSWKGAAITMPENMGYLTKPGIIAGCDQ